MALLGTFPEARRLAGPDAGSAGSSRERDRHFAAARRHTLIVKVLRFALPVSALLALASYGIGMRLSYRLPTGKIDTSGISISTQNLTMSNPRYEGFNKDGSRFTVTAKTAVQDIKQQGPVELDVIDGRLIQANMGVVTLTAPRGQFDTKANQLELFDDIKIRGDDGLKADLTRATVLMKENRIVSKQPVAIDMAAGQVRANEMDLLQSSRQVTFSNGVATRLRPAPRATEPLPAKQAGAAPQRLIGGGDAPVDIQSRTLRVDDTRKTAVFSGEVIATQGPATLRAPELQAFYDGTPVGPGSQPASGEHAGKLKRIFVPTDVTLLQGTDRVTADQAEFDTGQETATLIGRVIMTSGADRRITSDRADLDSHADTALLTGNVVVTQERNVLRGQRLYLDRRAGVTKLSSPADGSATGGRIGAQFVQAAQAGAAPRAPAKPERPANDASGFVFRTDPNAPIDIDADTLDVTERTKTAVFRGAVKATQGVFQIRTPEMIATYSGDAGLAAATEGKQASAQLTRVRANQKVEVTSTNDQSATGDWAEFDVKSNTVTLGGHVTLKKGTSVAYAPKAIIDMTTGLTYLERDNKGAGPSVSASPTEQRAPYTLPDLPDRKGPVTPPAPPAFASDPSACPPGKTCLRFDPKDGISGQAGGKQLPAKGSASPWQTETAPAPKRKAPAGETSGWTSSQPSAN